MAETGPRVSIGEILKRAFGTIGSNPLGTLGIAFLLNALPSQLLGGWIQRMAMSDLSAFATLGYVSLTLFGYLLMLFFSLLAQAVLVKATVSFSQGSTASVRQMLSSSLPKILPLLAVGILLSLGVGLGMILLIVPGVMLMVMWSVAVQSVVAEDVGVFDAFARSRELTKGHRWKVFGLMLLLMVLAILASMVVTVILGVFLSVGDISPLSPMLLIPQTIVSSVIMAVWGCALASLFISLREAQEGPQVDALAQVFE